MKLSKKALKKIALMVTMGLFAASNVYALPSQGTLDNSAAATISADAANGVMNIAGKGQNNIINWASFNIDKGEIVKFNDKNNYLNLVHGVDMSRIYGTISGGNAVYLVNPNGILFAEGATLDNVGGFVASTRNISSINKKAFLNDPSNTTAVLGVDNPVMDNKDYYPEGSKYVPKVTVADIQLTNVPKSATLILDGPGGVILKSADLLDKTTAIVTRKEGGEIGIGSENGIIDTTTLPSEKIYLVDGGQYKNNNDQYDVVTGYKWVKNWDELRGNAENKRIMLTENISLGEDFNTITNGGGTIEGLGYSIDGLTINKYMNDYGNPSQYFSSNGLGLFNFYAGKINNLNLNKINIIYGNQVSSPYSTSRVGGVAAHFNGELSNVNVNGTITINSNDQVVQVGGLIGQLSDGEIRNSEVNVKLDIRRNWFGSITDKTNDYYSVETSDGIGGAIGSSAGKVLVFNTINHGDIERLQLVDASYKYIGKNNIGGIVGTVLDNIRIIGSENNGNITILTDDNSNSKFNKGYYNIGGIIGGSYYYVGSSSGILGDPLYYDNSANIGSTYNWGKIKYEYEPQASPYFTINKNIGGIVGSFDAIAKKATSQITNNELTNYYANDIFPSSYSVKNNFGTSNDRDELRADYYHEMIGLYDFSGKKDTVNKPATVVIPNTNINLNPNDGNTGGGTTNPPSGGNTGSGTTNPLPNPNPGGNRPIIPTRLPNNPLIKEIAAHYKMSEADLWYLFSQCLDEDQMKRLKEIRDGATITEEDKLLIEGYIIGLDKAGWKDEVRKIKERQIIDLYNSEKYKVSFLDGLSKITDLANIYLDNEGIDLLAKGEAFFDKLEKYSRLTKDGSVSKEKLGEIKEELYDASISLTTSIGKLGVLVVAEGVKNKYGIEDLQLSLDMAEATTKSFTEMIFGDGIYNKSGAELTTELGNIFKPFLAIPGTVIGGGEGVVVVAGATGAVKGMETMTEKYHEFSRDGKIDASDTGKIVADSTISAIGEFANTFPTGMIWINVGRYIYAKSRQILEHDGSVYVPDYSINIFDDAIKAIDGKGVETVGVGGR